jgi:hypothetical protein
LKVAMLAILLAVPVVLEVAGGSEPEVERRGMPRFRMALNAAVEVAGASLRVRLALGDGELAWSFADPEGHRSSYPGKGWEIPALPRPGTWFLRLESGRALGRFWIERG